MGVYRTAQFPADASAKIISMAAYLNSLDGVTAEVTTDAGYSGFKFYLDDTDIVGFYGYTEPMRGSYFWLKNGDTYLIPITAPGTYEGQYAMTVHSYVDEKLILFSFRDHQAYRGGMEVALLSVDNTRLIGYKANTVEQNNSPTFLDISTLIFEEITDVARVPHTYVNMFPYVANPGTVDFVPQAYFVTGNNIKAYTSDLLKECSTVTLLSTVSLPSPLGACVALGTHCIAPLDNLGGEE